MFKSTGSIRTDRPLTPPFINVWEWRVSLLQSWRPCRWCWDVSPRSHDTGVCGYRLCFSWAGTMVPSGKKAEGLNPQTAAPCGVGVFSPCLRALSMFHEGPPSCDDIDEVCCSNRISLFRVTKKRHLTKSIFDIDSAYRTNWVLRGGVSGMIQHSRSHCSPGPVNLRPGSLSSLSFWPVRAACRNMQIASGWWWTQLDASALSFLFQPSPVFNVSPVE